MNPTKQSATVRACPACDLLVETHPLAPGYKCSCPRCSTPLYVEKPNAITNVQALCLTGLLLSYPTFFMPLMTLNAVGHEAKGSLFDAVLSFMGAEYYFVGGMVLLTSILFPLARFFSLLVISSILQTSYRPRFLKSWFRATLHLEEWAMLDIYVIGIGVTLIKVHGLAEVEFNVALFCLINVTIISILISAKLEKEQFWSTLTGQSLAGDTSPKILHQQTAQQAGLMMCHHCDCLVSDSQAAQDEQLLCFRCESPLHFRKHNSIINTWALLISSLILFIPANVLPIMRVYLLGVPEDSTIMDGIIYFFQHGSIGIGLIILTASVIVPLFKMVGLFILLMTIHFKQSVGLKTKIKMFHAIAFIGRWSMLDIFVIALMAILINFGNFTAIIAAPAATYFCLVVISTMLAATTFDPRLLWENIETP